MPPWLDRVRVVCERECRTVWRTRTYLLLAGGFGLLVAAVALVSGVSGYVPLVLSLLTPLELLVPLFAGALGYPAIVGERARDELDVHQTYPVSRAEYVAGVYLARTAALLASVVFPLAVLVVLVPFFGRAATPLPQSTGLDSPVLYFRFVTLTAVLGAVALALFHVVSAVARDERRGLVATLVGLLVVVFGFDAAAVIGLGLGSEASAAVAVLSPTGAYRHLVLGLAVAPVTDAAAASLADVAIGTVVLAAWLAVSLVLTGLFVWEPVES
ncbi:MAG: ABC transporter permease [Haloquadratum sp.]